MTTHDATAATLADEAELARLARKFPDLDRSDAGARARDKGAAGECEVVEILRAAGWPAARRSDDGRSQEGRGDIVGGPPGVHFEVRRRERVELWAWLGDAERARAPGSTPVLVLRRSSSGWYAALPLESLLGLLRAVSEGAG